jgi:hypothetical protein
MPVTARCTNVSTAIDKNETMAARPQPHPALAITLNMPPVLAKNKTT